MVTHRRAFFVPAYPPHNKPITIATPSLYDGVSRAYSSFTVYFILPLYYPPTPPYLEIDHTAPTHPSKNTLKQTTKEDNIQRIRFIYKFAPRLDRLIKQTNRKNGHILKIKHINNGKYIGTASPMGYGERSTRI